MHKYIKSTLNVLHNIVAFWVDSFEVFVKMFFSLIALAAFIFAPFAIFSSDELAFGVLIIMFLLANAIYHYPSLYQSWQEEKAVRTAHQDHLDQLAGGAK